MLQSVLSTRIALAMLLGLSILAGCCTYSPYSPPPLAFSGDSAAAKATVVVPTLDTPSPKGKNVIWCASFQLCWDNLKTMIGRIEVPGARHDPSVERFAYRSRQLARWFVLCGRRVL